VARSWKNLLKNKNFIYIWFSQILSQVTLHILNFTFLFTLFERTGSTIATSLIWISYAIPAVIIGPFASALIDMTERRRILILSNFLQSFLILFYALFTNTTYFMVYAVVMLYSSLNQFYVPAEFATLPHVAKRKLLPEANGLFLLTQQGSLILGFGVAGFLLKILGFQNTLFLSSFLLFSAFIVTLFLPKMKPRKKIPLEIDKAVIAFFSNIFSGYKFIRNNKLIMAPFLILICMQISLAVVAVNAPALASEVVKIPISHAGALIIVPGGIGAMLASFAIPKLLNKGARKIRLIKNSLLFLLTSLFMWVFIFSFLANPLRITGSFLAVFIIGFSYIGVLIPTQTFLQQKTPFGLRGRVFGNYWFMVTILSVFPVIVSGTITEIFGSRTLMAILMLLIIGLYWFLRLKEKKYLLPAGYN
jgi:MFS transporter, DHA3 family, macrolide efflux protein